MFCITIREPYATTEWNLSSPLRDKPGPDKGNAKARSAIPVVHFARFRVRD